MGRYIEVEGHQSKVQQLIRLHDATPLAGPPDWDKIPADMALVCVVENPTFDAAAYCHTEDELEAFKATPSDRRPRTWLLMDKELVESMTAQPHIHEAKSSPPG